jgi:nicotinamide-nucleotide amidase
VNVELINTGSELMLGRVLNTHQQWLCRRLADLGLVVTRQIAIADSSAEIKNAVAESLSRADLIITTGGLGPTSDDLTRELIAELLGKKLIEDANVLRDIENYFAKRNRPRPTQTRVEAFVPEGAIVLQNKNGTAPGLAIEIKNRKSKIVNPKWLIILPGPPRELRPMFDEFVVPLLKREFVAENFICRTLRTSGIGESIVQEKIESDLQPLVLRGLEIGYCARPGAVDVRLSARGANAKKIVAAGEKIVQKNLDASIFGFDDEEIESVVVKLLTKKKKTLALAESCTGGLIAHRITNVPGASEIFRGGIVAYSNAAKEKFLGVRAESLKKFGAVSEQVAREMAAGAREKFGADFAIAVTGIAGPSGGTVDKPVGTVFIAMASALKLEVKKFLNVWERDTFKQVTSQQALAWLIGTFSA